VENLYIQGGPPGYNVGYKWGFARKYWQVGLTYPHPRVRAKSSSGIFPRTFPLIFFKTSSFKRERPSSCGKERAQKVNCCALFRPRTKHDFPNSVCRSPEIKFLSPSFPHTHPLQNGKFRAAHGTIFFSCLDLQKSVNLA